MPPVTTRQSVEAAPPRGKKRSAALSCAECRRLKLRCDRKFPCSACIKRGCSAICPDGSLTTGKGNRFVLANTERLHDKISELSNRVRELEDALGQSHSLISNDYHPLLREDLLNIKNPLEREMSHDNADDSEENDNVDALGSLSMSQSGRANFFGHIANSWYILQNEEGQATEQYCEPGSSALPTDIPWLSHTFPFAAAHCASTDDVKRTLLSLLPSAATAREIADRYFDFASWMYEPIPRYQFDEIIFPRIYQPETASDFDSADSHRLAVLFGVLAVGTMVNLNLPRESPEAAQYYHLARAAIALDSVLENPSETAIQALFLMCHYLFLTESHAPRWAIMGIITKLCQSIGLHRDSTLWNLSPEETQRRRELMWEVYVYDSWQCLTFGRPPSFSMAHIDCKMPQGTTTNSSGQVEMSYNAWKHRFCADCLHAVHDQIFGAKPPAYALVIEMDKKVRNYYVPPSLQVPGFGRTTLETEQPSMQLTMQRHIILAVKEVALLYMHRGFFARAMDEHPEDPLGSRYGKSVLAAHRSASSFIALIQSLWLQHKEITERLWFLFTHVFSCAILLGSIPVKCPSMGFARSSLQSLDHACDLFSSFSTASKTSKILPILRKLRERAQSSMAEHLSRSGSGLNLSGRREMSSDPVLKQEDEEFATLGGKTRFVSPKTPSSSRDSPTSSNRSSSGSPMTKMPNPLQAMSQLAPPATPPSRHGVQVDVIMPEYYLPEVLPQYSIPTMQHAQSHVRSGWQQPNPYSDMGYHHQSQQHLHIDLEQLQHQREQQMQSGPIGLDMMSQPQHHQGPGYYYEQAMYAPSMQQMSTGLPGISPPAVDPEASWRNWVSQFNTV